MSDLSLSPHFASFMTY